MCFNTKLSKSKQEITKHFNIEPDGWKDIQFTPGNFNAFTHPQTPIICQPNCIETAEWGLIPTWVKDKTIQASTLNARIETLAEKPSFKNSINNRCLIIADGFYEWQWLDAKGNRKQTYLLELPGESLFTFAGLFSDWTNDDPKTWWQESVTGQHGHSAIFRRLGKILFFVAENQFRVYNSYAQYARDELTPRRDGEIFYVPTPTQEVVYTDQGAQIPEEILQAQVP